MTRFCLGLACFLGVICPLVMAQETPPDNMDKILARAEDDEVFDPGAIDQIEKFAKDFMWRPKCDALERTQFASAELEAKADHGDKAVEILEKLGASSADPDVKSATQYDVARVYQRRLKDTNRAAEAYKKVTGRYAPMAQRDLVRMWQQGGQAAKAIEYLQGAIAHSKDKGEKLGLLLRLGRLCQDANRNEDALAAYRQIADEFTQRDLAELKAAVVKRVAAAYENIWELSKQGRSKEIQDELRKLRIWVVQLDAVGREDEARLLADELDAARRQRDEDLRALAKELDAAREKFDERRKNRGKEPVVEKKDGEPK